LVVDRQCAGCAGPSQFDPFQTFGLSVGTCESAAAAVVRAPGPDTAIAIYRAPLASADAMADACETSELSWPSNSPHEPGHSLRAVMRLFSIADGGLRRSL